MRAEVGAFQTEQTRPEKIQENSRVVPKVYELGDLHPLSDDVVKRYLKQFLCDASEPGQGSVLARPDFQPDSFTIEERFENPCFLSGIERDGHEFLASEVAAQIGMLQADNVIAMSEPEHCAAFLVEQIEKLMHFGASGGTVAAQVYNQELTDVSRRVIAYCLSGDPNHELRTHQAVNRLARRVVPLLLERHLAAEEDPRVLLAYSIASGLVGLDVKGREAAASPIMSTGIALGPFLGRRRSADDIVGALRENLDRVVSKGLLVDHWDFFAAEALGGRAFRLAWFTDDFIETLFDLLLAQKLLDQNPALTISLIPKDGYYGNDASYNDLMEMLCVPVFAPALANVGSGRLRVLSKGPLMGTGNLRKLSRENADELRQSDAVYVKGCRIHEMLQGGIDAVTYTSFVVAREFTESETGLDARETPLVFFRSEPGEYAYWGFKARESRRKAFPDGRAIGICYSTLEEHERRRTTSDPRALTSDLNRLVELWPGLETGYRYAYDRETALIVDRLTEITKRAYNNTADRYAALRREEPSKKHRDQTNELVEMARARAAKREVKGQGGKVRVLDAGTGQGRDLGYLARFENVEPVGVDNAPAFIRILRECAGRGEIPGDSFLEMDIRSMSAFQDQSFDVVRHNASLVHLPMLPNRIGADEALAESYRVLKPHGLLYVSVKAGEGLHCEDTGEGLGTRVCQHYSEDSLSELLQRNGFDVIGIEIVQVESSTGLARWVTAFAEKPSTS